MKIVNQSMYVVVSPQGYVQQYTVGEDDEMSKEVFVKLANETSGEDSAWEDFESEGFACIPAQVIINPL